MDAIRTNTPLETTPAGLTMEPPRSIEYGGLTFRLWNWYATADAAERIAAGLHACAGRPLLAPLDNGGTAIYTGPDRSTLEPTHDIKEAARRWEVAARAGLSGIYEAGEIEAVMAEPTAYTEMLADYGYREAPQEEEAPTPPVVTLAPVGLVHTPADWPELERWIEAHPASERAYLYTAALMAWNLAARLVADANDGRHVPNSTRTPGA